jgi:uncharacterized protein (DUF58 family)
MFFGSVQRMKSVTAAEAGALAAWRVLEQQDRVGALVFNDNNIIEIRPQRSRSNVMRILQAVVQQNRALSTQSVSNSNPAMFNQVLRRCDQLTKHDFLVCIISDCDGQDEESRRLLTRIAWHNDVLFGFVFDSLEAELPAAGPLVFANGEQRLEVDTGQRSLRDRYSQNFSELRSEGRHFLQQRETPVIPLNTTDDVAEQVRRRLGKSVR